jgi:Ca2+-binding RTX toxin-like protein
MSYNLAAQASIITHVRYTGSSYMFVVHRKLLAGLGVTAAAVASTALVGAPAQAASAGAAKVVGTATVQFNALMGKSNTLTITISGRTVTLDDKVAIKAGKGCKAVKNDKTKVKCTTSKTTAKLSVALGDKNDTVTNKTKVPMLADGGAGNDVLKGGSQRDVLFGQAGNDKLYGFAGYDKVEGGDLLVGGAGNDYLDGGAGDVDILDGEAGADIMKGGAGKGDIVFYGDRSKPVIADLDGAKGDDGVKGEKDTIAVDVEGMFGGNGADTLGGGAAANIIWGGKGNDVIRGGKGNDLLYGQAGNDKIYGDANDDDIVGEDEDEDGNPIGSDSAKDVLDGGAHTNGDRCVVFAAGTTVNCEVIDLTALAEAATTFKPLAINVTAAKAAKAAELG